MLGTLRKPPIHLALRGKNIVMGERVCQYRKTAHARLRRGQEVHSRVFFHPNLSIHFPENGW